MNTSALSGRKSRIEPGSTRHTTLRDHTHKQERRRGLPKQYCGQLSKRANFQSLISLILARDEVPVMVGLRLFMPEEWSSEAEPSTQAGFPDACVVPKNKGQIALDELDRVLAAGARFGTVLANPGYGTSAAFRHGLDERSPTWVVEIAKNQKVYASEV